MLSTSASSGASASSSFSRKARAGGAAPQHQHQQVAGSRYECFVCHLAFSNKNLLQQHIKGSPFCNGNGNSSGNGNGHGSAGSTSATGERGKPTAKAVLPGFVPAGALTKQHSLLKEAALAGSAAFPASSASANAAPASDAPRIHINGEGTSSPAAAPGKAKGKSKAIPIAGATSGVTAGLGFHQPQQPSSVNSASSMARSSSVESRSSTGTASAPAYAASDGSVKPPKMKKPKWTQAMKHERDELKRQAEAMGQGPAPKQKGVARPSFKPAAAGGAIRQREGLAAESANESRLSPGSVASQGPNAAGREGAASPAESIASSTDELVQAFSLPKAKDTPKSQNKGQQNSEATAIPASTRAAAPAASPFSSSPFQAHIDPFSFLASRQALAAAQVRQGPASEASTSSTISTQKHGPAAGSAPTPAPAPAAAAPPAPPPSLPIPPLVHRDSGKRIPQSPLLWSSGPSAAPLSAPTLGSPAVPTSPSGRFEDVQYFDGEDMPAHQPASRGAYHDDNEDYDADGAAAAIQRARYATGRDAVVAALAEKLNKDVSIVSGEARKARKAELEKRREELLARTKSQGGDAEQQEKYLEAQRAEAEARLQEREAAEERRRELQRRKDEQDNDEVSPLRDGRGQTSDKRGESSDEHDETMRESQATIKDGDGVVRQDMAQKDGVSVPAAPHAPQQNGRIEYDPPERKVQQALPTGEMDASTVQAIAPAVLKPTPADEPTTSTTNTAEEEDDGTGSDAGSDASVTSRLVRTVVRDLDTRSWDDLADVAPSTQATRKRLQLEQTILALEKRHRPSATTLMRRREMVNAVRKRLNGLLPEWRPDFQYTILPFGSTAYGLDTDSSDLDLCIVDPKRLEGFRNVWDLYDMSPQGTTGDEPLSTTDDDAAAGNTTFTATMDAGRRPPHHKARNGKWDAPDVKTELGLDPIYDVRRIAGVLRRMNYREVIPIPSAGVPIVKFKSADGIKADMNANEQLGVRNSALLKAYVHFSPVVRPFLIFLKAWAKQRGLNDPSGAHGAMSLSSYSLILMAIGYLQHAGVVPNLQDLRLVAQSGMEREAFWTKVPNKNAIKPGMRGKGRYLGDYKAMVVETTFVRELPAKADWKPSHAAGSPINGASKAVNPATLPRHVPTGWDSDDAQSTAQPTGPDTSKSATTGDTTVTDLAQGFFHYYLGFPLDSKAVSIWAGRPLDRSMGYLPLAADADGIPLPTLPKITREEREELYEEAAEEAAEESGEEIYEERDPIASQPDQQQGTLQHTSALQDTNAIESSTETDEERLSRASLARYDALLRAHGINDLAPSFEDATRQTVDTSAPSAASPVTTPGPTPTAARFPAHVRSSENGQPDSPRTGTLKSKERASGAHTGLELHHADETTGLFPFPEQERPEDFVEPPTWTQKLVVQDPFIHTRNTCLNIVPRVVDRIMGEMQRAYDLLQESAPLDKVCLSVKKDSEFRAEYYSPGTPMSRAARRIAQEAKKEERLRREQERRARKREATDQARRERRADRREPGGQAGESDQHGQNQGQSQSPAQGRRSPSPQPYQADNGSPANANGRAARRGRGFSRWKEQKHKKREERQAAQ